MSIDQTKESSLETCRSSGKTSQRIAAWPTSLWQAGRKILKRDEQRERVRFSSSAVSGGRLNPLCLAHWISHEGPRSRARWTADFIAGETARLCVERAVPRAEGSTNFQARFSVPFTTMTQDFRPHQRTVCCTFAARENGPLALQPARVRGAVKHRFKLVNLSATILYKIGVG